MNAVNSISNIDEITGAVIDASISLHRRLGPGLFESVYEAMLAQVLTKRGLRVERQKPIRLVLDDIEFDEGFRLDLLVEERVIVEVKSRETLLPVHMKQVTTYLRLTDIHVGLLINFGEAMLKDGIHRIVNKLPPSASTVLRVNQGK